MTKLPILLAFFLLLALPFTKVSGQAARITGAAMEFQNSNWDSALEQAREGLSNSSSLRPKDIAKGNSIVLRSLVRIFEAAQRDTLARKELPTKHPTLAADAYQAFENIKANDPKGTFISEVKPYLPVLGQAMIVEAQGLISAKPPKTDEGLKQLVKAEALYDEIKQPYHTLYILRGFALVNKETHADSLKAAESLEKALLTHKETLERFEKNKSNDKNAEAQYNFFVNDPLIPAVYSLLITLNANTRKDLDKAAKTAEEGKAKYPDNEDIVTSELNMYLNPNLLNEAISKFKAQIAKDASNIQVVMVYAGLLEKKAKAMAESKQDPAQVRATFDEAIEVYKKALAIDPNERNANFNIGAIYVNRAVDMNQAMSALDLKQEAEYEKMKAEKMEILKKGLPYLEKASKADKTPDPMVIRTLYSVTLELGLTEKATEYKKQMDALPKK